MKRSRIQPKASWKRLERSTKPMIRSKRLNPIGPKGKAWNDARADLKMEFLALGVTSCELRYDGCWFDDALGFAHAAKRRKLTTKDLGHVILCCNPCHDQIEFLPPEKMKGIVDTICRERESMLTNRQLSAL